MSLFSCLMLRRPTSSDSVRLIFVGRVAVSNYRVVTSGIASLWASILVSSLPPQKNEMQVLSQSECIEIIIIYYYNIFMRCRVCLDA